MTDLKLSDEEIEEVNSIVQNLQNHVSKMQDNLQKHEFSKALVEISEAIKSTTCPLCKEKLAYLSTLIIKSKISCKKDTGKCNYIIKKTVDEAEKIKTDFIPISTEKRYLKEKASESQIDLVTSTIARFREQNDNLVSSIIGQ